MLYVPTGNAGDTIVNDQSIVRHSDDGEGVHFSNDTVIKCDDGQQNVFQSGNSQTSNGHLPLQSTNGESADDFMKNNIGENLKYIVPFLSAEQCLTLKLLVN